MGCVIYRWKGIFKTFATVCYKPPKFLNFPVPKKQTCNRLVIAEHVDQKNRNGKTTTNPFLQIFLLMIMWAQTWWMDIFILAQCTWFIIVEMSNLPKCWCCENGCLIWWVHHKDTNSKHSHLHQHHGHYTLIIFLLFLVTFFSCKHKRIFITFSNTITNRTIEPHVDTWTHHLRY